MMAPSVSDMEAARRILSGGPSNERMKGLPRANLCPHILCGSGEALAVIQARTTNDVTRASLEVWRERPYRHHEFTANAGSPWCICGNSESSPLHNPCILVAGEL